jgi:hypothetical protein
MIPQPLLDLLDTGVSVMIGTRDAALMPECTRAWGIRVEPDRASVTVFVTEPTSRRTLTNLRENGRIAITCTRPSDHTACQLKGRVRLIRPSGQRDEEPRGRWKRKFYSELMAVGVPAQLCEALITDPVLAVEVDVQESFGQTPGPGAGDKT